MDLFSAVPALHHHPLLKGKKVALVGVSTIVRDDERVYFEISKPKYWRRRMDGSTTVGVGGVGGTLEQGESVIACLRREVEEELGTLVRLAPSPQTYLIHQWRIADRLTLVPTRKRVPPLMVILTPPRLGGSSAPDHLAIVGFRSRLRGIPDPRDLFGLLGIAHHALADFFARDEVPLDEALLDPDLTVSLNAEPPPCAVLRPVLTGRAFQCIVQAGYREPSDP